MHPRYPPRPIGFCIRAFTSCTPKWLPLYLTVSFELQTVEWCVTHSYARLSRLCGAVGVGVGYKAVNRATWDQLGIKFSRGRGPFSRVWGLQVYSGFPGCLPQLAAFPSILASPTERALCVYNTYTHTHSGLRMCLRLYMGAKGGGCLSQTRLWSVAPHNRMTLPTEFVSSSFLSHRSQQSISDCG